MFKELVLQCLVSGIVAGSIEQSGVLCVILSHSLDLFVVVGASQSREAVREHFSAARIQLLTVILRQLGAEGVDGDDDCTTIGLECEDLAHHVGGGAAESFAESVEGFEVSLVQSVSDDFDVHLVQVLLADAVNEKRGQWGVDEHCVVQLCRCGGDVNRFHLFEASQGVALRDELGDGALVEGSGDQQDDVIDHVAVGDEVQESRQWLDCVISHVLELDHELLTQFVVDD